jgi:hypothetical protein
MIDIYLEIGGKRTFACASGWPGWSRSGQDEAAAMQALLDYAPRYARAIRSARLGFRAPKRLADFTVAERLSGNSATDFGAPSLIPTIDAAPVSQADLSRPQAILRACWRAFDAAVEAAQGKPLLKGPRGGGRDLAKMVEHVQGAEAAYLSKLGWKLERGAGNDMYHLRQQILKALPVAARGELPKRGPRGGLHWPLRYYVRRAAWHLLDHAWEIEDRAQEPG